MELAGETGPPLDSLREGDWLSELINERDLVVVAIIRESSLLLDPVGERDTLAVTITKGAEEVVSVIDTLGETGALSVLGMEGDGQFELVKEADVLPEHVVEGDGLLELVGETEVLSEHVVEGEEEIGRAHV